MDVTAAQEAAGGFSCSLPFLTFPILFVRALYILFWKLYFYLIFFLILWMSWPESWADAFLPPRLSVRFKAVVDLIRCLCLDRRSVTLKAVSKRRGGVEECRMWDMMDARSQCCEKKTWFLFTPNGLAGYPPRLREFLNKGRDLWPSWQHRWLPNKPSPSISTDMLE